MNRRLMALLKTPSWDNLREADGYNPGFEAWLNAVEPERKDMWMKMWIEDGYNTQQMFWWLERVECDEAVAEAIIKTDTTPSEFQDAYERGDLDAMGKFLAERVRNQREGKPWK